MWATGAGFCACVSAVGGGRHLVQGVGCSWRVQACVCAHLCANLQMRPTVHMCTGRRAHTIACLSIVSSRTCANCGRSVAMCGTACAHVSMLEACLHSCVPILRAWMPCADALVMQVGMTQHQRGTRSRGRPMGPRQMPPLTGPLWQAWMGLPPALRWVWIKSSCWSSSHECIELPTGKTCGCVRSNTSPPSGVIKQVQA